MNSIAIIPARSGSKGLKDKNIKLLEGKPLLSYTIHAAIQSKQFDIVYVSTDSEEYASISRAYGASVPSLRPKDLSEDQTSTWDVVKYILEEYKQKGVIFDTVMLLQPTSPLRTMNDIIVSFELFKEKDADAVVSVCETEHSPLWCNTLPEDLCMNYFLKTELSNKPRQELQKFYRLNGAIYLLKTELVDRVSELYNENCYAYVMKKEHSIDIDDIYDFRMAEAILKERYED